MDLVHGMEEESEECTDRSNQEAGTSAEKATSEYASGAPTGTQHGAAPGSQSQASARTMPFPNTSDLSRSSGLVVRVRRQFRSLPCRY